LLSHGTCVLLINQNNCRGCDDENPKFADLQALYKDTNVRFATFNVDNNVTYARVARTYAVNGTPTILVIREDGAFATFTVPPPYPTNALIDLNTVKSAIDDAQKWHSLNPTATVVAPTVSVMATYLGESGTVTSSFGTITAAAPGNKFVTYAVYCENINAPNIQMGNPYFLTLRDTEGNLYNYDYSSGTLQQQVGGRTLGALTYHTNTQPGDKVSGLIAFQIPTNATPKSLTYDDYMNRITINL
jgi:hypothetical protein